MWPNPQETAYLVTFAEEILNGKLHFLCSEYSISVPPENVGKPKGSLTFSEDVEIEHGAKLG